MGMVDTRECICGLPNGSLSTMRVTVIYCIQNIDMDLFLIHTSGYESISVKRATFYGKGIRLARKLAVAAIEDPLACT